MDNDENHLNKKLDAEFRRILRIIKPYIPCIMNNEYLTSYRLWLEKLSEVSSSEKEERNRYIMELCYQIQDGILEYPFTQMPRDGPLPPFRPEPQVKQQVEPNFYQKPSSSQGLRSYSDNYCYNETISTQQQQQPQPIDPPNSPKLHLDLRSGPNSPDHLIPKQRTPHTLSKTVNSQLSPDFHNMLKNYMVKNNTPSPENSPISNIVEKLKYNVPQKIVPLKQQRLNVKEDADDEESWYDITDMSTSTMTKLESEDFSATTKMKTLTNEESQEIYEHKITELMKIINDLQKQNLKLNKNVISYEHAMTMRNTNAETSIHNLVDEVNSLKNRLQELRDIKAALKSSQTQAANQWQCTIATLTEELDSSQKQNSALRSEIVALEKKLNDVVNHQKKENSAYKQSINALHEKEIEKIKQNHCKQIKDLEEKFNNEVNKIKQQYENKTTELQANCDKTIEEKDREIHRLENLIEVQCKRMHEEVTTIRAQMEQTRENNNESNSEKVLFLQKCIAKMDKLFKKSEKNFIKQISKLKTEIEKRDKIIQIQLSSQRAELIANTNAEKQQEIDATIVQLEERYRRLLENQQNYFTAEKKHDTGIISQLRALIAQHNIDSDL